MNKYMPKNKDLDITLPFRITGIDYDMWVGITFTNTKGQSITAEPDFSTFKRDKKGKYLKDKEGHLIIDRYPLKEFCEKDSSETREYLRIIGNTEEYILNENYNEEKDEEDWDYDEEKYIRNPDHVYIYSEPDGVGKAYNFKFEDFVDFIPLSQLDKIDQSTDSK